jgi:asparaginyl-tRNA synthetase
MADPVSAEIIKTLNPGFQYVECFVSSLTPLRAPARPFKRLDYKDAIAWLNENGIKTDEGKDHVVGDDIAEAAERRMVVS